MRCTHHILTACVGNAAVFRLRQQPGQLGQNAVVVQRVRRPLRVQQGIRGRRQPRLRGGADCRRVRAEARAAQQMGGVNISLIKHRFVSLWLVSGQLVLRRRAGGKFSGGSAEILPGSQSPPSLKRGEEKENPRRFRLPLSPSNPSLREGADRYHADTFGYNSPMETLTLATHTPQNPASESLGQENDLSLRVRAIDPALDLEAEIVRLKKDLNAVILAHYYQDGDIQDLADHVGDSLALAQAAAATDADVIVFCGVHFMAETAKILNPNKLVLLPDLDAGCSLADRCPADLYSEWLKQYPGHTVINYINSSAAVKALSDIIVTSSNAVDIVRQLPPDQPIVFGPDRHLGRWVEKQTGREMVLWPGFCIVHEQFNARRLAKLRAEYPNAQLIAHPECEEAVLEQADFIGSTLALLEVRPNAPRAEAVHRRHRSRHPAPDEAGPARRRVSLLPAQLRLQLRVLPLYAAEHTGKAVPLPCATSGLKSRWTKKPASAPCARFSECWT